MSVRSSPGYARPSPSWPSASSWKNSTCSWSWPRRHWWGVRCRCRAKNSGMCRTGAYRPRHRDDRDRRHPLSRDREDYRQRRTEPGPRIPHRSRPSRGCWSFWVALCRLPVARPCHKVLTPIITLDRFGYSSNTAEALMRAAIVALVAVFWSDGAPGAGVGGAGRTQWHRWCRPGDLDGARRLRGRLARAGWRDRWGNWHRRCVPNRW